MTTFRCTDTTPCAACSLHAQHADTLANIGADCACECYNDFCLAPDECNCTECEAEARRRTYNTRYVDYVNRRANLMGHVTEQSLTDAHIYASGAEYDCAPPDGYRTAKDVQSEYDCPRCEDTGYTVFVWVDDGICFDCGGRSRSRATNPDGEYAEVMGGSAADLAAEALR